MKREIFLLILCLVVGFVLRFYTFDRKSLWMDEIHTFNDSKDGLNGQIEFYKNKPSYFHPPLFFILTHFFYPFTKPESDLRILPLFFGTLSIPTIYFLARLFSSGIALPCAISLALMTYHISLSQDGRPYTLVMFLGMIGLYFFIKYLKTSKIQYLLLIALSFAILFYTSYSSIPFIYFSQILWFYKEGKNNFRNRLFPFLVLNSLLLLFIIPWILFTAYHYKGQLFISPFHLEAAYSFLAILENIFHDWVPHSPLMISSLMILILLPFFLKNKLNAFLLLMLFILPVGGLYLLCKLLSLTHFVTSRYFINFLPPFLISLYLSLEAIELRFERLKKIMRLKFLFAILFIASNLILLPLYYSSEKQDLRGLATYLKSQLRDGDKIFVDATGYIPGILFYFGVFPNGRHYVADFWRSSGKEVEFRKSFIYQNREFTIYHSNSCCNQYVKDGNRLWIIAGKWIARKIKKDSPCVLKNYFDGSFLNFNKFPTDASLYLFLWDPQSPDEKGIDKPIE